MAGAILDEGDEVAARTADKPLVDEVANRLDDLQVGPFRTRADIVAFAYPATGDDGFECAGMILDMQPVADILAASVDR